MSPHPSSIRQAFASIPSDENAGSYVVRTLPTRSGDVTAEINGVPIHSTIAPAREAGRIAAVIVDEHDECDVLVVFGFGLGYLPRAIARIRPSLPVAVVEPIPRVALESGSDMPWQDQPDDISFWGSGQLPELLGYLQRSGLQKLFLAGNRTYQTVFPDQWKQLEEAILSFRHRTRVNRNTLRRFGKMWVRNILRNSVADTSAIPLGRLENLLSGLPAIVCGAGPTLEETLPKLPQAAEKAFVIAAETALRRIESSGVTPDFVVTVDPQYWNTRHLDRAADRIPILVTEPAANPRSLRLWSGPIVLAESVFPLGRRLWGENFGRSRLGAGGSVATTAWDLARFLGASAVYMTGVDLGYPELETHCRDTFYGRFVQNTARRTHPAETFIHSLLSNAEPHFVPSAGGDPVLSDQRMHVYRLWFKDHVQNATSPPTFLTSPRSSQIEGCSLGDIEAFAELTPVRAELQERLARFVNAEQRVTVSNRVVDDLCAELAKIGDRARETAASCEMIASLDDVTRDQIRFIQNRDTELLHSTSRHLLGFLLGNEMETAVATPAKSFNESARQSQQIHRAVADSARLHADLIARYRMS